MDTNRLDEALKQRKQPDYRRRQILRAQRRELVSAWSDITTLPAKLREELAEEIPFSTVTVDHEERSQDGSIKLRLLTDDGFPLEAVLMRFDQPHARKGQKTSRYTACLSSQSGCALACSFCATGRMKLGRNLTPDEIVDQYLELARRRKQLVGDATEARIDNIVMMGMGEPFHNYDNVITALKVLNDPEGPGLAARRIAISTVGWVPGIEKLAKEPTQFKLALSLHAPNNELRSSLMPVNKRFPIERLMQACQVYRESTKRRIFVEYLMLEGVNDSTKTAHELGQLLSSQTGPGSYHVNLIAYNPTDTDYVGSSDHTVRAFAEVLAEYEIEATYRVSRARDISGACGQLAAPVAEAKRKQREARLARMTPLE